MNDNDGGLAAMIIGQWVTVLLLALISQRRDFEAVATGLSANAPGDIISATHQSLSL